MQTLSPFTTTYPFFDIAANLCDDEFKGIYHDKKYHDVDIDEVLKRASDMGVKKMLFSAGCAEDTVRSYELSLKSNDYYITSGIHPCRASEALQINTDVNFHYNAIKELLTKYKSKAIAIGECGLDYDRLHYSCKEDQIKIFPFHFDLAKEFNLPLYLHSRNTGDDFYNMIKENRNKFVDGVVHSFTESESELNRYLELGLFIGVNGASFKTKENLEVVKKIPLDKLMIETDAPYCEIKSSSAAFKLVETKFEGRAKKEKMKKGIMCKDRNEPCSIIQVLEVLAKLKGVNKEELAKMCYDNTIKFFKLQ